MTVNYYNETDRDYDFDEKEAALSIVEKTLDVMDFPYEATVDITLVDNNAIHELNLQNRNIDSPTDVLSFPMIEYESAGNFDTIGDQDDVFDPDTDEAMLGDIILSYEKIDEQAKEYGHSQFREFAFLITHSMLHLLGFDHMEDEERLVMEEWQRKILDELGIKR